MRLVKYYSPVEEFDRIFRSMNDDKLLYSLAVDIQETEDTYLVTTEVPGFTADEVEIEVHSDQLVIKANHKTEVKDESENNEEHEETSPKYIYRERIHRNYYRKLKFKKPIKAGEASSSLANGILTITLPKTEEAKPIKLIPQAN